MRQDVRPILKAGSQQDVDDWLAASLRESLRKVLAAHNCQCDACRCAATALSLTKPPDGTLRIEHPPATAHSSPSESPRGGYSVIACGEFAAIFLNGREVLRGAVGDLQVLQEAADELNLEQDIFPREVTVCAHCLTAACWQGKFYCDEYMYSGTVQKTVRELLAMHLEPPSYWGIDDVEVVRAWERREREA